MAVAAERFEQIATTVSARAAELLCAQVSVVDDAGVVVASSRPQTVGSPLVALDGEPGTTSLRVPVQLGAHDSEIIVTTAPGGEALSPRLAQVLVDLIVTQTTVVSRLPNQHELKDKFIHDVLHGAIPDEADILRQGQILGMDFMRPRAVILIDAADFIRPREGSPQAQEAEAWMRRRAQIVIASVVGFFNLPSDTICGYIGDGEVAVLKASSTEDLVAWANGADGMEYSDASWANLAAVKRAGNALLARLRRDTGATINIGIGRYHPTIHGLARSYDDARAALSLGRRFHGQNQMHCLDSLGIAAFVGVPDERTKIDLATHLLSPLDQEPELLETLDVFFDEDCCPSSSAKRLVIHRNTLSYRLAKITSLTGLDPRRFDDAVQMRLALVLRALRAA